MLRIKMKFDTINPFLRLLTGTIHIEDFDINELSTSPVEILVCKVRKEEGVIGYSSINENHGIPSKLFATFKPIIDSMVKSYWKGMILEKDIYEWLFFDDSDESWNNISRIEEEKEKFVAETIQDTDIEKFTEVEQSGSKSF